MIEWLKSLFRGGSGGNLTSDTTRESDLLGQYEVFLAERMKQFYPAVRDAFATLLDTDFPDSVKGLHIEVFIDDPAFSFRLFGRGKNDVWAEEPEQVTELNDRIDRLWPIVTEDEMDQYMIWEDDSKWGRQIALEQPLDKINMPKIVLPWFEKIVSETRGDFSLPITASVHDITLPEEL